MPSFTRIATKLDNAQRKFKRAVYQFGRPVKNTAPVFVVGCQRSGTSMILRVFDLSLNALVYWPRDPRAYVGGRLAAPETIQAILDRSRASATVFKPMLEIQRIPQFLKEYPNLRVVWIFRDFYDAANSAARKWANFLPALKTMVEQPEASDWRAELLSDDQREFLLRHYHDDISLESGRALFWYLRNSFFFEFALQNSPNVKVFEYDRLVTDPPEEFRKLFEFCNCPFSETVTREIYSTSIRRHPIPDIDPEIVRACEDLSERFSRVIQQADQTPLMTS